MKDVCAAALPRAAEGREFHWSPDARGIAYLKPVADSYGLRVELDLVSADGSDRKVLLTSRAINQLFPATHTGHQGNPVPPPRSELDFQWGPDGLGLLLFNNLSIYWLDTKTLRTTSLVTGEDKIADAQLSPDGRTAAFVRGHNLWIVSTAGGAARAITRDGTEDVRKGELDWMYPAELGTRHGYAWSPDSSRIAYLEFDLTGVARYTPPFQLEEDPPSPTIDYPEAGAGNPRVRAFVVGVDGKSKPVALATGGDEDAYLPRLQWLPDGRSVAVQRLDRAQSQLDLLLADASTGAAHVLLTEKDQYWINLSDILYFMKGAPQFVWSSERSGYRHLYLYGLDGKLVRPLTEGPWEVTSLDAVDERRQRVYFTSTRESPLERHLYVAGFHGDTPIRVTRESGTHEATFAPDAGAYVDRFSTAVKPWTQTVYKLSDQAEGPAAGQAFAIEGVPVKETIVHRTFFLTVTTHDGEKLNAMLIQPENFSPEKKYPVVVYAEGGPGQQAVRDRWNGDASVWQRLLAERGYVIFAIDNRGTSGRGHLFEEYLHDKFASYEMTDLRDGLDFLKKLPYVNPARVGIWGRGFGGAVVVNSMFHPQLGFRAGFAVAPIADWLRFDSAFAERYLGSPKQNLDSYLSSSPLDGADSLKNPLLVAAGTADPRIHPEQTMELQHELVEAHKYAEISLYPGQTNHIEGNDACVVLYQRATDFFAGNL